MRARTSPTRTALAASAAAALVLFPVGAAVAGGSDAPTPYTVTADGLTLPDGVVFEDNGHVNIRYTVDGVERSAGVHFESLNNQPSGQFIGLGHLPWSYLITDDDYCITWVQVSLYNEHFGEGGQDPVCTTPVDPEPTPEPTEPTEPTPEPTPETTDPTEPTPEPTPEPTDPVEPAPEPTDPADPAEPTPEPTDPAVPTPGPTETAPTPTPTPETGVTPDPTPTPDETPDDTREQTTVVVPGDDDSDDPATAVVPTDDGTPTPTASTSVVDRLPWTGSTALPLGLAAAGLALAGGAALLVRRWLTR